MPQTLEKHFKTLYPWAESSDIHTSYAPYRVCPLGAHIDHQYGIITGFALDKGVTLRFLLSTDGAVNLDSLNFAEHVSFVNVKEFFLESIDDIIQSERRSAP